MILLLMSLVFLSVFFFFKLIGISVGCVDDIATLFLLKEIS